MRLTLFLIAVNVLVFFLSLSNLDYFLVSYGFSPTSFLAGNYYTIITSMFLHADLLHLAGNMFALLVLGAALEKKVKAWQYILAYFVSGIAGGLSILIPVFGYAPETIAVGASAAISGLVGLGIFVCPGKFVFFPSIIPLPFALAGAIYLIATLSNIFVPGYVAYSSHLLGFLAGALFGLVWGEKRRKRLLTFMVLLALIVSMPTILRFVLGIIERSI